MGSNEKGDEEKKYSIGVMKAFTRKVVLESFEWRFDANGGDEVGFVGFRFSLLSFSPFLEQGR